MRRILIGMLLVALGAVIVIPTLVVRGGSIFVRNQSETQGADLMEIRLYREDQGKTVTLPLEDYVKGVVAAEMPAEFAMEALKAQAVASRTYVVHQLRTQGKGLTGHPEADIGTGYEQGQAWVSEEQLRQRWGFKYPWYKEKIDRAVETTQGLVITYDQEPINAVFHSTSGERTADALEVWGTDVPYLKSVVCKWDQESPRLYDNKKVTLTELTEKLGPEAGVMSAMQNGTGEWAQVISRTPSGRIEQIRLGSKNFSGVEVRRILGLRSTNFTWKVDGDQVYFSTTGYGHGVGMCQYGANGMAKAGYSFRDILCSYYTNVNIEPWPRL